MRTPYCILDRRRFWMRIVGMLLALSASCVFPLRLYASLPQTHNWLSSLMSASCLGLMADSCLCKLSLQLIFLTLSLSTMILLSFLELAEEDCFGHANVFHPCDVASLGQLHLKQDGLHVGQAGSQASSFDSRSCHLMPRMERKQR